jgi:ubiquinone/menaquinone biosynthesis C-methylase UbiE
MKNILKIFRSAAISSYLFATYRKWSLGDLLDAWYAGHDKSPTIKKIFREIFEDDYLEEVDANSFVSKSDLKRIAECLRVGKGDTFVDLACGRGGPGLWIARENQANLTGVDISKVAIDIASKRVSDFGLNQEVSFRVGNFEETGLPDHYCDGAVSIDALFLAPDKTAAMVEIRRILRPGANFVFTTWEGKGPLTIEDHRGLAHELGFEVEVCEETKGWRRRQTAVYERILSEKEALEREMGELAAKVWIKDAGNKKYLGNQRRILMSIKKLSD